MVGVKKWYEEIVVQDQFKNIKASIRSDIQKLLETVNQKNPYFKGKFDQFLKENSSVNDEEFLAAYKTLPALSKKDYADAGSQVMNEKYADIDPKSMELQVGGKPIDAISRLRNGNYLMPMATGGSTSTPLVIHMTKRHMFSMLFTFFKCWFRMGWRPGERMLVFYPKNTYNIDDMVKYNPYSRFTGFKYHLFDKIDKETVEGLVNDINKFKPKLLLVFPSPMNMIAHTIRRYNLKLTHHPQLINVSGETFFDCQRRNIESVFTGSKVEDSYGSVELGELGHETEEGGLEIFSKVAYVETEPNEAGMPEMVITRLDLTDFPFIRYKMRDIATVEFKEDASGNQKYVITNIEGKDSNYIQSDSGQRFYPSFFNNYVNQLNIDVENTILEIKVYEQNGTNLEVQFIIEDKSKEELVKENALQLLRKSMSETMNYDIKFVDFIDHDYRRKYRVIQRIGDIEFAGGMVGDERKTETVGQIQQQGV